MSISTENETQTESLNTKSILNFESLNKDSWTDNCTVVGCIVNCYPIQSSAVYGKYRKLLLKEVIPDGTLGDKELPCFLYGKYVDQIRDLVRGDCITITGFELALNQCYKKNNDRIHRYQVNVITQGNIRPVVSISKKKIVKFGDLAMISKRYGGICIAGQVTKVAGIQKTQNNCERVVTLKEVLSDDKLGDLSLDCVLQDKLASQNRAIKEGEKVLLSGFHVEARPSTSAITDYYQFQVVLRPTCRTEYDEMPSISVIQTVKKVSNTLQRPKLAYQYTLLKDLKASRKDGPTESKHFNVYGVVVRCLILNSVIKKCLEIVLRDQSLDSFTVLVSLRPDSSLIPDIHPNDIIRIHRLYVNEQHAGLQGICNSTHDLLIFSGTNGSTVPRHTSRTFTWTDEDKEILDNMQKWKDQTSTRTPLNGARKDSGWISKRTENIPATKTNDAVVDCVEVDTPSDNPPPEQSPFALSNQSLLELDTRDWSFSSLTMSPDLSHKSGAARTECQNAALASPSKGTSGTSPLSSEIRGSSTVSNMSPKENEDNVLRRTNVKRLKDTPVKALVEPLPTKHCRRVSKQNTSENHSKVTPEPSLSSRSMGVSKQITSENHLKVKPLTEPPFTGTSEQNSTFNEIPMQAKRKLMLTEFEDNTAIRSKSRARNCVIKTAASTDVSNLTECSGSNKNRVDVSKQPEDLSAAEYCIYAYNKSLNVRKLPQVIFYKRKLVSSVTNPHDPVKKLREVKDAELNLYGRVQARVLDVSPCPSHVEDSLYLHCSRCHFIVKQGQLGNLTFFKLGKKKLYICPKCEKLYGQGQVLKNFMVFHLKLDDGSAAINASLFGQSAEFFFGEKDLESAEVLKRLAQKLSSLYVERECTNNPPFLDCYLFKYSTLEGHAFEIVGTKLL